MTCKDCIHYDVCKCVNPKVDEMYGNRNGTQYGCGYFKDKSQIIKLPCKVGDTVYLVDFEYGIYKCIVNDIQILSDNEPVYTLYFYSQNGYEPAELEWDIDIEIDCFGKTVFLTKEQAEAKLKELSDKCQL